MTIFAKCTKDDVSLNNFLARAKTFVSTKAVTFPHTLFSSVNYCILLCSFPSFLKPRNFKGNTSPGSTKASEKAKI